MLLSLCQQTEIAAVSDQSVQRAKRKSCKKLTYLSARVDGRGNGTQKRVLMRRVVRGSHRVRVAPLGRLITDMQVHGDNLQLIERLFPTARG